MPLLPSTVLVLLVLLSLATWCVVVARYQIGLPLLPYRPREAARLNTVAVVIALGWIAIQIAETLSVMVLSTDEDLSTDIPTLNIVWVTCFINFAIVALLWSLLIGFKPERLEQLGVTISDWRQQLWEGLIGCLASFLPVIVVLLMTSFWRTDENQNALLQLLQESDAPEIVLGIVVTAVVGAPLAEELLFRVILQGWLMTRVSVKEALLMTAAVFSLVHGFPDAVALFPLALVLGYVYHQRNRYFTVVCLHACFNAVMIGIAILGNAVEEQAEVSRLGTQSNQRNVDGVVTNNQLNRPKLTSANQTDL